LPEGAGAEEAGGDVVNVDVEGGFELAAGARQPGDVVLRAECGELRFWAEGGEPEGESVGVRLWVVGELGVPVFELVEGRSVQGVGREGAGGGEVDLGFGPIAIRITGGGLGGDGEAEVVDCVVVDEEVEGGGVTSLGKFVGDEDFGPDAGVVELDLMAGEEDGASRGVGRGRVGVYLLGPLGGRSEKLVTGGDS
jgi:hypothetical protein